MENLYAWPSLCTPAHYKKQCLEQIRNCAKSQRMKIIVNGRFYNLTFHQGNKS